MNWREKVQAYVQLTKPRIVLLVAITGLASMVMEKSLLAKPVHLWMVLLGIVLSAGSANALNQWYDRDIDAVMKRTSKKRPLPQGRLSPFKAMVFSIATGALGTALLYSYGNWLAAALGVGTIAYYVLIYTMWLKRSTPYNIVIGGAAGATAPLIGWAAATGTLSLGSFLSFLIIFMWTPPHFWALALCVKDEYAEANVPMLPVVMGEPETRKQIFIYTLALVPLTLGLFFTRDCGVFYLVSALLLGGEFIRRAYMLLKKPSQSAAWKLFGFSIVYLLALYLVMIVDALI